MFTPRRPFERRPVKRLPKVPEKEIRGGANGILGNGSYDEQLQGAIQSL